MYPCQMVMLAMGFLGPEKEIVEQLQLAQDPRSNIATTKTMYATSATKVYAAGGKVLHCVYRFTLNSLAFGRWDNNFKILIFKLIMQNSISDAI